MGATDVQVNCPHCGTRRPMGLTCKCSTPSWDMDRFQANGYLVCTVCNMGMDSVSCPVCRRDIPAVPQFIEIEKGCFIATAAMGSRNMPEVETLRRFRDTHLSSTAMGRIGIRFYEWASPPLARMISHYPILRWVARTLIVIPLARRIQGNRTR